MYSPLVHPSSFYSYLFIPLHLPSPLCNWNIHIHSFFFSTHTTLLNRYKQTNRVTKSISLSPPPPPPSTHISHSKYEIEPMEVAHDYTLY